MSRSGIFAEFLIIDAANLGGGMFWLDNKDFVRDALIEAALAVYVRPRK